MYKNPQTNTASVCDAKKKGAKKARLFYEIHNELRDFFTDTSRSTPDTINTNSEDIFFSKNPVNTGDESMLQTSRIFFQAAPLWTTGSPRRHSLKIHLDTGRFHQIRCQLAAIGCPIVRQAQNTIQAAVQKKDGRHYVCVHINLNLHILSHIKKCIFLY